MSSNAPAPVAPVTAEVTENAWQLYQVTMEWVRHADAKATALLAANATLAAALLALDKVSGLPTVWAGATLFAALLSFVLAGWSVLPNLRSGSGSSLVFFDHAAKRHPTSASYVAAHRQLLTGADDLVADLADQTWNLARVAHGKFLCTGVSIVAFLIAAVSGGLLAVVEVLS